MQEETNDYQTHCSQSFSCRKKLKGNINYHNYPEYGIEIQFPGKKTV